MNLNLFDLLLLFFCGIVMLDVFLNIGDLTASKTFLVKKYSHIYSNTGNYPTLSSLENELFKKEKISKSIINEFSKDISLMLVFIGLLTNTLVSYFTIKIESNDPNIQKIYMDSLTSSVDFLFDLLGFIGIYILYQLIMKSLKIDAKKDTIIKLEKDCINEEIIKRKSEVIIRKYLKKE